MHIRSARLCLLLVGLSLPQVAPLLGAESVQGAVVTRTEGDASFLELQSNPKQKGSGAIIFEKMTYFKRPLKKGDRPRSGDVIVTNNDGKARLIFRNGDQITITPGTAYKFSWDTNTNKNAIAEILYGDIRAVIQPGGPREGMKVQTKTAAMGVRGTDFYASAWSAKGGSQVAVIRGRVTVAAIDASGRMLKDMVVPAGSTGVVKPTKAVPNNEPINADKTAVTSTKPTEVLVQATSKEQLVVIQSDSKVAAVTPKDSPSDATKKELEVLEKQAVETTMKDIQKYDPSLYAELNKNTANGAPADSDTLQAASVKKIFVEAPSEAQATRKPTLQDLDSGGDIYEKYKWKKPQEDL